MNYEDFIKDVDEALPTEPIQPLTPAQGPQFNRQLFENHPRSEAAMVEYKATPEALHNAKPPNFNVEYEKAEHRIVMLLKLKGMTNTEIAAQTGYSVQWLSQLVRQPWFQKRLTQELAQAGQEIIDDIIKVEAHKSLATLVELRDCKATPAAVRQNSAMYLINRLLGTPTSRTENVSNVFHVSTKLEDLDEQLREVEEAEKALLTRGTTHS